MAVMSLLALLLLAAMAGLLLQRAVNKPPFTRQRPPIIALPLQHRSPRASNPPSNSYLFDTVPDTTSSPNSVTLKSFTMHMEEVIDSKVLGDEPLPDGDFGVVTVETLHMSSHGLSQNSLHRSVSQLIERKSMEGEEPWDRPVRGHTGMFIEEEEFVDTIKGFSTVRKEHTMFTDTNL